MGAALGLLASLIWGAADYGGGVAARRIHVAWVILTSQAAGLIALLAACGIATLVTGLDFPAHSIWWGAGIGAVGVTGLAAFYTALSTGTMGVVAPIASAGVALPVIVSIVGGERPSAAQVTGIVIAAVGIILASGPELSAGAGGAARRSVLLALFSGLAFGFVALGVARGATGNVLVTLTTQRAAGVAVSAVFVALRARSQRPAMKDLPLLASVGLGDGGANAAYAAATRQSLVSVASVLSSLYPVVTALLAWRIDKERLRRIQVIGVVLSMLGVVLLAAG